MSWPKFWAAYSHAHLATLPADDNVLMDEMLKVLKEQIVTANALMIVVKGTETRIDAALQLMLRELKALFGNDMWHHVIIGVSFWSYSEFAIDSRNRYRCYDFKNIFAPPPIAIALKPIKIIFYMYQ
jgi:hypothetical protein